MNWRIGEIKENKIDYTCYLKKSFTSLKKPYKNVNNEFSGKNWAVSVLIDFRK